MNIYEKRSQITYDKKAKNYDSTFDGKFTKKFKEMLDKSVDIKVNDTVLDVACGNGRLLQQFAKKAPIKGFGVDISENMIEEAKKLNPNMEFYVAGCENLPFEEGEIDVMTVCAAYHHFPDVIGFAKEAKRVTRNDGRLYIAEICIPALFRVICNPFVKFSKAGDVKIYSSKEIVRLFEMNGFVSEGVEIKGFVQVVKLRKSGDIKK